MSVLIRKLQNELLELNDKTNRLEEFLSTPKFHSLPTTQKTLLCRQFSVMNDYIEILNARIEDSVAGELSAPLDEAVDLTNATKVYINITTGEPVGAAVNTVDDFMADAEDFAKAMSESPESLSDVDYVNPFIGFTDLIGDVDISIREFCSRSNQRIPVGVSPDAVIHIRVDSAGEYVVGRNSFYEYGEVLNF